jgi:hypothetical protein
METSRNKQPISSKLSTMLSSVMKSHPVARYPTRNVNHPYVQCIHTVYATHPLVT